MANFNNFLLPHILNDFTARFAPTNLSGGVESRHAGSSDPALTASDSRPEAITGDTARRSGSSAPPAQLSPASGHNQTPREASADGAGATLSGSNAVKPRSGVGLEDAKARPSGTAETQSLSSPGAQTLTLHETCLLCGGVGWIEKTDYYTARNSERDCPVCKGKGSVSHTFPAHIALLAEKLSLCSRVGIARILEQIEPWQALVELVERMRK